MLLKVYVEDTLPFFRGSKGNVLISWTVNDSLPLSHPQQLASFATALNLSQEERDQVDVRLLTLMHGSQVVDTSLTPPAAMLVGGTVLTMASRSTTPRTMRQLSSMTPRNNNGGDSPRAMSAVRSIGSPMGSPKSLRGVSSSRNVGFNAADGGEGGASAASPAGDPVNTSAGGDDGSESRYGGDTNASPSEYPDGDETASMYGGDGHEEVYVSEECGWFPFHVNSNYGQLSVATCIDPMQPAKETDRNPPMQQLCPQCSQLLGEAKSLRVPVDRHYKPMSLNYEISEGWVEKLSLGRFSRWQKRYLMVSERSIDWFQSQPAPGDKAKIRGMRHTMRDGVVNISDIIDNPDPAAYPKCKDTNYFHFGVVFKHPSTTMFFRVPSLQQRDKYVTFLKQMVTRLSNTGAQKDPVYWKRWSDALLTNMADLGEVASANKSETTDLEQELAEVRLRRQEIREEMPGLQQVLEQQRSSAQALKKELANIEEAKAEMDRDVKAAEDRIELESIALGIAEIETGDEMRKAEVLRAYVQSQEGDARRRIEELTASIEELQEKHALIFGKWRKLEEASSAKGKSGGEYGSPNRRLPAAQLLSFSATGIPLSQSVRTLPEAWRTPSPTRRK